MEKTIKKVLIANRGEIAVRVIRACKEMGIKTVAVYSTADKEAMHVKIADESICIGSEKSVNSYLNKQAILSAAIVTNTDAIHPGYGFLSENSSFVEMAEEHGFIFIGPSSEHLRIMGDKIEAKKTAIKFGLPTVPGSDGAVKDVEEAKKIAKEFGYPIILKAASGGGGRGMKVVFKEEEIEENFNLATNEAAVAFGDGTVYIEKFLQNPRHIEVQILGDKHGNVLHLFERDCSIQRRNQKVIEEALSPALSDEERNYICNLSAKAMQKMGYYSAGTIEYLYEDGKFYFMEMNTRLQVEHPVTEFVTGVDLVYEMIRIAQGKKLKYKQEDIKPVGHAIECRINAEDPETFIPSPGKINYYHPSAGPGVRIDTAVYSGYSIPPYYDSMVAKLIVHGQNREHCLLRLRRSLDELIIDGTKTNIPLHLRIINEPDFINGTYNIKWLEKWLAKQQEGNS
jgi:acetyl-CoA carboxylase biotin carboxylase subunit